MRCPRVSGRGGRALESVARCRHPDRTLGHPPVSAIFSSSDPVIRPER